MFRRADICVTSVLLTRVYACANNARTSQDVAGMERRQAAQMAKLEEKLSQVLEQLGSVTSETSTAVNEL